LKLALRFLLDVLGQLRRVEALAEFFDFVPGAAGVAFAELFADRLELFLQVIAALALVDVLFDLGLDLRLQFEHVELRRDAGRDHAETFFNIQFFEQQLLVCRLRLQVRGEEIGERGRVRDAVENLRRFVRRIGRELDDAIRLRADGIEQRIKARALSELILDHLDLADRVRVGANDRFQPKAHQPMHDDRLIAVRQFEQLEDHAGDANVMQVVETRILHVRIPLRNDADHLVAGHDIVEQRFALRPSDIQRHDRAGEDDDVADRQDRQDVGHRDHRPVRPCTDDRPCFVSFNDLSFSHVNPSL
jgi:hypothetical protein